MLDPCSNKVRQLSIKICRISKCWQSRRSHYLINLTNILTTDWLTISQKNTSSYWLLHILSKPDGTSLWTMAVFIPTFVKVNSITIIPWINCESFNLPGKKGYNDIREKILHGNFVFPSAKPRNGFVTIPIVHVVSKATALHAYPNLTSKTGNVCLVFSQWLLSFDQQCSSDGVRVSSTHQTPWKKKIVLRESKPGFIPQERLEGAFWTCDRACKLSLGLCLPKKDRFS